MGELSLNSYGDELLNLIKSSGYADRIQVTGFIPAEEYALYLECTDAAVQLRVTTRGETSRAVLDCLAFGIPTILNDFATFKDYPDSVVKKISESLTVDEIATAMAELYDIAETRRLLSENSYEYVNKFHNPEKICKEYADVIYRAIKTDERNLFSSVVSVLAQEKNTEKNVKIIARDAAANLNLRSQPRILVDVSDLVHSDHGGGYSAGGQESVQRISHLGRPITAG